MHTTKAREVMVREVLTVHPDTNLIDAIRTLLDRHITGMPVVDEQGALVGMVSEHDMMNFALSGDADTATVGEAMSREVVSFSPDSTMAEVINGLAIGRLKRVPIVAGGKVVGIIGRREVLEQMLRLYAGS